MTFWDLVNPFVVALVVGLAGGVLVASELLLRVFPYEEPELLFCDCGCGRLVAVIGDA